MNMKQLSSGLVVPAQPEKPKQPLPGIIQDEAMRKEVAEGLMKIVRALGLDGSGLRLPGTPDCDARASLEHQIKAVGSLCLGARFEWEVKT